MSSPQALFAGHQNEIYLGGLTDRLPRLPIDIEALHAEFERVQSAGPRGYVDGGAGRESTMRAGGARPPGAGAADVARHLDARAAAHDPRILFNRDAAAGALRVMRADDPRTFLMRELAGRIAPRVPLAGAWLASVPPLGRLAVRPGASTLY
jgi:hypothetical protein